MPLVQLDSENADLNLTSQVTVLTDTPSATEHRQCQAFIAFGDGAKNLDGTGGDFEISVTVGGQTVQPDPQTVTFSTAPRCAVWTTVFPVPSNSEVVIKALSPNGADTDVDVTAQLFDVPVGDAIQISGDATAADNLELQYDTTGLDGSTFPATQSQVTGIANTGSATHTPVVLSPDGFTLTTGTNEQNNEDATRAFGGLEHQWDSTGNAMEGRYTFDLGGVAVPTELTILGRLNGAGGDTVQINVNTGTVASPVFTPSLNQRGEMVRQGSSTNLTRTFTLYTTDLMTGVDAGKVQIQIVNDGAVTGATFSVDQMFCSQSSIADPTGYSMGAIWYDDSVSNTNTVVDIDGTARNPVSTWAAVLTLNGQLGLHKMHIANGSTVQLSGNSDKFSLEGESWILQLNGKSIANMHARGARSVTGTSTGSGSDFHDCNMGTCTIAPCDIIASRFTSKTGGGFTMQTAGDYTFHGCGSMVPGNDSPVFTFPAAGDTFVSDRAGSGGRQYEGMSAGDLASVEGWGQFIEGTCSGGAVTIRGCLTKSGITNITLTDEARFDLAQIRTATGLATANLDTQLSAIKTDTGNLVTRITAALFNGITSLAEWLGLIAGKQVGDTTARTELRATGAGSGTYDETVHSQEVAGDIVGHADYGNAQLVRSTTPANTLDINNTGIAKADLQSILATQLTETSFGYIAAAFIKLLDVAIPVLTVASVDQTGDNFARLGAPAGASVSADIAAIMGSTGTGARTVAVTVNDGAAVLENATVRYTEGANTYVGQTDASGELSFSLDDATYAVAVSKVGYTFTPTTLVVDGNKTPTYSMAVVTISAPPNASTTTGVMTVIDEEGSVEAGVTVTVQILAGPGTDGIGYDSTEWAELSSASGVVEFAGIILGARYRIWRGTAKADVETFTAPTTGTSFDLAEVIGRG